MDEYVGFAERVAWLAPSSPWVLVVDPAGRIEGVNAAAERLAGATSLADVLHEEDLGSLMAALGTARATVVARLRGSECGVAWRIEPAGRCTVLLGRALTDDEVRHELARCRLDLVRRLVTAVAHDANNNVSAISANVQYVEGHRKSTLPRVDTEIESALRDARSACAEIEHLTKSLRLLAEGVSMDPMPLGALVHAAVALAAQPVRARVRLQFVPGDEVPFHGHRQDFLHAMVEILQWASQYAEPGTTMTATVRAQSPCVWLRLVDGTDEVEPLPWVARVLRDRLGMKLGRGPAIVTVDL